MVLGGGYIERRSIAVFCMLVIIILIVITGCGAFDNSSQDAPSPEIIHGGPVAAPDEFASAGEVKVYNELAAQIKASKGKETLFVVKVVLCGVTNDLVEEQERIHDAYMDARNVPIVQEYWEQYDEWSRIPIEKLDSYSAQFRGTGESMPDSFYAYWVSTHTKEEKAAYDAAWAIAQEKYNVYISMYDDFPKVCAERTFEEANRLQDEGLMLVWKGYSEMIGLLTGEQIMQFPVNERYGYYIVWADTPETGELASNE